MNIRDVRVAAVHMWPGFDVEHLNRRFPALRRKYRLIPDSVQPDLVLFSVFATGGPLRMPPTPTQFDAPTLFLTSENVVPDMTRCDFAVSFSRDITDQRHMRIPNWVQRLAHAGISPRALLTAERSLAEPGDRFCAFVYSNPVPLREELFRLLSRRGRVDAPGASMNNIAGIGPTIADKQAFLRSYRFGVAFENASAPGYTTEKLPETLLAGAVPLYWGDPLVGMDFNPEAFLDFANYDSLGALVDAVTALDADPVAWRKRREQPPYRDDRLPECADDERIFTFWEQIIDALPARSTNWNTKIVADLAAHRDDTSAIGFHGDIHLISAVAKALADATLFVESGANRGVSLAYAAALRPDLPMRSCEPSPQALSEARVRCANRPLVRISSSPSPQALVEVLTEFPSIANGDPVFWLDAHAHGVPLPLGRELALLTRFCARAHVLIDDFQIPGRPWFGFDSYPDGIIGLDYIRPYLNPERSYSLVLPSYRDRSSTHHDLRGWCCLSWGKTLYLPADEGIYERRIIDANENTVSPAHLPI